VDQRVTAEGAQSAPAANIAAQMYSNPRLPQ
jgi:hypothetical protein